MLTVPSAQRRHGKATVRFSRGKQLAPPRISESQARRRRALLLGLGASLPLIFGAVSEAASGWRPVQDIAMIVLRSRDVLSTRPPLVGQFSQASYYIHRGVYSPGPSLYWLLALPATLIRWWPAAPLVFMALVQTVVVVGIIVVADRLGGHRLAVMAALGTVLVIWSITPTVAYGLWDPYAPILPLLLLAFTSWAILCGDRHLLPLAAALASFAAQAHSAFVAPAAALIVLCFGAATARLVVDARRGALTGAARRQWLRLGGATGVVVVLFWAPAVIDQLVSRPGNITLLMRSVGAGPPGLGMRKGIQALGHFAGIGAWWTTGRVNGAVVRHGMFGGQSGWWIGQGFAVLLVMIGLGLLAARRRRFDLVALIATALVLALSVVVTASLLPSRGPLVEVTGYSLLWATAAGVFIWIAVAWTSWLLYADARHQSGVSVFRLRPSRRLYVGAFAIVALVALGVGVFGRVPDRQRWAFPVAHRLAAQLEPLRHDRPFVVAVRSNGLAVSEALVLELRLLGIDARANAEFAYSLGPRYQPGRNRSFGELIVLLRNRPPAGSYILARTRVRGANNDLHEAMVAFVPGGRADGSRLRGPAK